ncbi:MAG: hypothetical protein HYY56_00140 [Candidatus Omnitrophica bacterium]|nr:hypothetical protein [Candidatus Omnitrophota bacterium]
MTISIDEFKRLALKVATIKAVKEHPSADRLYILTISTGSEEKDIVAGIKLHYTTEELIGRQVIVADNLEPAVIRGVESKGMVLAVKDGPALSLIVPDKQITPGCLVS